MLPLDVERCNGRGCEFATRCRRATDVVPDGEYWYSDHDIWKAMFPAGTCPSYIEPYDPSTEDE